jgi:hypothetical protein
MYKIQKVKLLEVYEGQFEGTKYGNIIVRFNERLTKFKVDVGQVAGVKSLIDEEVDLTFEVVCGYGGVASLKVVSVEQA